MFKINSKGRTYVGGQAIGNELRSNILDKMISDGGDQINGFFPGKFKDVAEHFQVSSQFVSKLWSNFCFNGEFMPRKRQTGNPCHLKTQDIELVEFLKKSKPSTSYKSIKDDLEKFTDIDGGTSISAIANVVRNKLSEGPYTWKRLIKPHAEKFTNQNILYCQAFLDFIYTLPPNKVKFFDEAGVNVGVGNPVYGSSLRGTRAVQITPGNLNGVSVTLNLLCGLEGILYVNTVNGASDSIQFLNFFGEAGLASTETGYPAIEQGDIIIMDNCPTHRYETGNILARWLLDMGVYLIYTPFRSPEFNAAELVFNKMKVVLKRDEYASILKENVHVAIYESLRTVTEFDMIGFYRHLDIFNM